MIFNKLMADYIESVSVSNDVKTTVRVKRAYHRGKVKKTYPRGKAIICLMCDKSSHLHASRKIWVCDSCDLLYNTSIYHLKKNLNNKISIKKGENLA